MKVFINGEIKEVPEGVAVGQLLEHFSLPTQRVAVEINHRVIRRGEWENTLVNGDDRIEIIHFVGGG
jgi:sulfur carrier protein